MGEKLTGIQDLDGCDHGMKLVTGSWEFLRALAEADSSQRSTAGEEATVRYLKQN